MRRGKEMDEPILQNQRNYRCLLHAMSHPGHRVRLEFSGSKSIRTAALTIGQCLLDHEVSICILGYGDTHLLLSTLIAATQVREAPLDQADFVFILGGKSNGEARRAKRGEPDAPEAGATLIYFPDPQITISHRDHPIRLTGPGIAVREGILPE